MIWSHRKSRGFPVVFCLYRFIIWVPTSVLRHVGRTPLDRHRFCAMSGERLWTDIGFAPCRENASGPRLVTPNRHSRHM